MWLTTNGVVLTSYNNIDVYKDVNKEGSLLWKHCADVHGARGGGGSRHQVLVAKFAGKGIIWAHAIAKPEV